jgi:phi13 family phage major tail protein
MAQVGLTNLYYAVLQSDVVGQAPVYGTPKRIVGAITANINPNSNKGTLFGDNGPMEVATVLGAIDLELNTADLPLEQQAELLGHGLSNGVMVRKSSSVAPWVAVGFESNKSNGKKRFVWLVKGKFSEPEQKNETKNDNVNFQTPTINGSFVKRDCDDVWEYHADEDASGYTSDIGTAWFGDVYYASPLTATVAPANGANDVVVSESVVWTFSEAIEDADATTANFKVIKVADGSEVAGAVTIDVTHKIVTLNPTSDLTAATVYYAKALAGCGLAADKVTIFATA